MNLCMNLGSKLKKFKFLFMITFLSIVMIEPSQNLNVKADNNDFSTGVNGSVSGCTSGYCFRGTTGFRVTIVTKDTNERCYYNPDTKTICDQANRGGPNGKKSISLDIWFDTGTLHGLNSSYCYAFKTKRTKQEFVKARNSNERSLTNNIGRCDKDSTYNKRYKLGYLGFPGENSKKYHAAWRKLPDLHNTPTNMRRIKTWLSCKQLPDTNSKKNRGGICRDQNGDMIKRSATPFNKIYNALFYGDPDADIIDVSEIRNRENSYIQFEQLLQIYNYHGSSTYFAATGTVAEASYIFTHKSGRGKWCVTQAGNTNYGAWSCDTSMVHGGYFTGWYSNFDDEVMHETTTMGSLSEISESDFNALKNTNSLSKFYSKDTANVFNFFVKDFDSPCTKDLKNALKSGSKTSFNDVKRRYASETFFSTKIGSKYEIAKWFYDHNTSGDFNCESDLTCGEKAAIIYKGCSSSCSIDGTSYDYKGALAAYTTINTDAKYENSAANKSYIELKKAANSSYVPNSCANPECEQSVVDKLYQKRRNGSLSRAKYDEYINFLYDHTTSSSGGKFEMLKDDVWNTELHLDGPECKAPPNCPPNPLPTFNCGSKIEISDNGYNSNSAIARECWQSGFASTTGSISSSIVSWLGDSCYIYCSEKVSIDMPDDVHNVKAGTVFKWGKNPDDINNNLFATMEVSRSCVVSASGDGSCEGKYASYHATDFKNGPLGTKFRIQFEEPSSPALSKIYDGLGVVYKSSSGGFGRTCLDTYCSNIGMTEMKNYYEVQYKDTLKWYSSKIDGSLTLDTSPSSLNKKFYYEIGYGLPSSFTTPDGDYNASQWHGNGGMTALIKNLGVNGHFNSMLSGPSGVPGGEIQYVCKFEIKNNLFGDDCEYDSSGHLKSGSPDECDPEVDSKVENNPKGIDVVFRTIELIDPTSDATALRNGVKKAFPGRTGSGTRSIGSNWWEALADSSVTDNARRAIIGDILDSSVYTNNAEYHIKLDVGKIQQIRKVNKNTRDSVLHEDPYSKIVEYNGISDSSFNDGQKYLGYYCTSKLDGTGKETYKFCASEFLSALKLKGWLDGDCMNYGGDSRTTQARANALVNLNGCHN